MVTLVSCEDPLPEGGILPLDAIENASPEEMEWLSDSSLSIVVVGASGDLAKVRWSS
jgi:hypothetical protein